MLFTLFGFPLFFIRGREGPRKHGSRRHTLRRLATRLFYGGPM